MSQTASVSLASPGLPGEIRSPEKRTIYHHQVTQWLCYLTSNRSLWRTPHPPPCQPSPSSPTPRLLPVLTVGSTPSRKSYKWNPTALSPLGLASLSSLSFNIQ